MTTPRLELLPAVDVADGQAVQLVQGVAGTGGEFGDPWEAALAWQEQGAEWLHLVDLDAAFGRGSNRELLADIVGRLDIKVEMSGGIRDAASLEAALATGCRRVNLGTAALEDPEWTASAIAEHGDRDRRRARRARHDAGRAWLDPGGRRPLGDAGAPRPRGVRPLRRHRRQQGRHAQGPEPRAAARRVRPRPTARSSPPAVSRRSPTSRRSAVSSPTVSRARSSGRRSTVGRSRCPTPSTWPAGRERPRRPGPVGSRRTTPPASRSAAAS